MWRRAAGGCALLRRVRFAAVEWRQGGRVQAGDGALRRCGSFDGHRRRGGCGAAARNHDRIDPPGRRQWCSDTAGRSTSSPATASWRCSGRQSHLEDHAFRACLAALDIQREVRRLAQTVEQRDGIDLQLRVGLNSGEVIAGEMGTGPGELHDVGEQVGMAQRMESVAPPGGVMLSESTARLVEAHSALGEQESVQIKGAESPVMPAGCSRPRTRRWAVWSGNCRHWSAATGS